MARYAAGELPVTDKVAERNLALPMGPELTAEQVQAVVAALEGVRAPT
jgi:dTDP-4-amino-4,6-dideoxygalactose transaminase